MVDGKIWTTGECGDVSLMEPHKNYKVTPLAGHNTEVRAICAFSFMDLTFMCTGDTAGLIQIWNAKTTSLVSNYQILKKSQKTSSVISMCTVMDSLIFVGSKKHIFVLAIQKGPEGMPILVSSLNFVAHSGLIQSMIVDDAGLLWTCCHTQLYVWTIKISKDKEKSVLTVNKVADYQGHYGEIRQICKVTRKNGTSQIWTTSVDKSILVWDTKKPKCRTELRGSIGTVDMIAPIAPDLVITGSSDVNDHHFHFWGY